MGYSRDWRAFALQSGQSHGALTQIKNRVLCTSRHIPLCFLFMCSSVSVVLCAPLSEAFLPRPRFFFFPMAGDDGSGQESRPQAFQDRRCYGDAVSGSTRTMGLRKTCRKHSTRCHFSPDSNSQDWFVPVGVLTSMCVHSGKLAVIIIIRANQSTGAIAPIIFNP